MNPKNFFPNLKMPTCLLDRVKLDAKKSSSRENLTKNQCININENKALSGDVYSNMCSSGCLVQFSESMKLFKFSLLTPPSTSRVERGFLL